MSAYLLDTNALIYHYEGAPIGRSVGDLFASVEPRLWVTDLTLVEIRSALAGRVRGGFLTTEGYRVVMRRFHYDTSSLGRLAVTPIRRRFVEPCIRLLEEHSLRGGLALETLDCLHLLAAIDLKAREPDLALVTADRALANVTERAGVTVMLLKEE